MVAPYLAVKAVTVPGEGWRKTLFQLTLFFNLCLAIYFSYS